MCRVGSHDQLAQGPARGWSTSRRRRSAPPSTNPYLFSLNVQIVKEAQAHKGATSVFTYPKFASHGQYTAYLPIDGHQELVRTPDGSHLTRPATTC